MHILDVNEVKEMEFESIVASESGRKRLILTVKNDMLTYIVEVFDKATGRLKPKEAAFDIDKAIVMYNHY